MAAEHGTFNGYSAGCRCRRCRRAWNEYMRDYRQRHREGAPGKGHFRGNVRGVRVHLTDLALRLAQAATARHRGKTLDDVIEASLRSCAASIEFQG